MNRELLVVSAGIAVGVVLIVAGLNSASTGREGQRLPVEIETMSPGPGDQVLRQSQVFVDLQVGYEAALTIDGIALETTRLDELTNSGAAPQKGAQVEIPATAIYDPGNATIGFLPQEGAAIEQFTQGEHTATVTFWKVVEGREKARSFTWTFSVN